LDEAGEELAVLELEAEGLLAQVPDGLQLLRLGSISGNQQRMTTLAADKSSIVMSYFFLDHFIIERLLASRTVCLTPADWL
jgi:hypothetical protein